ncbi:MauE/DoxX family redox-associated membrane protein [Phenylobacterium sp.]|uniref:MauE/DoxX family redox-associated membrane protein n=1 Tax=Phenylobacterium sp. TaxID=1871053 RepID=UPI0035B3281A
MNDLAALEIAIRTAAALLFLESAFGKFADWRAFEGVVANYRLLPDWAELPVARLLPPVEAAIGALLLAGLLAPWPALAAAGLLAVFAGAMGINVARGRAEIDCGCGRRGLRQPLGWGRVGRNLVLAALLLAAAAGRGGGGFGDWAVGLVAGACLFFIDYGLGYLSALTPRPGGARS